MRSRPLSAVVLAAGEGTRMRSSRPKPLHVLCGRPMVLYVLDALSEVAAGRAVVVVGHGAERVTKTLHEQGPPELVIDFVEQRVPRGTGDAVSVALTAFPDDDSDDDDIVVLPGDTPLVRARTLAALVAHHREEGAAATVLTAQVPDPTGYGRVCRAKDGRVTGIVEELDATEEERAIDEVNTGMICFRRGLLAPALRRLRPTNVKGEYYLTDVVGVLHDAGYRVAGLAVGDASETMGVNDRLQLAEAEAEMRRRINQRWMRSGVTMVDPGATYLDATVELAADVTLFPGTVLQGRTVVAAGARIGPQAHLQDCVVGEAATVSHTVGNDAEIGAHSVVGPFAVLRPGAHIPDGAGAHPFYTGVAGDDESL